MRDRTLFHPDADPIRAGHMPIHRLGQNFLKNESVARTIVSTIPDTTVTVFEIGPGTGILTERIAEMGFHLVAYEIDARLFSILRERFADNRNVTILNHDALKMIDRGTVAEGNYIVSNLPFNISSAILGRILDLTPYPFEDGYAFCGATLMFQKEFADRITAPPGSRTYGRMSVSFQSKLKGEMIARVDRSDFDPEPEVDAAVIVIEKRREDATIISDTALFERTVRVAFSQRRKQLKNTLSGIGIEKEVSDRCLETLGFSRSRPEDLSVSDFIDLSNALSGAKRGNR